MASCISASVFITNGPPRAIGSPIGLPDISKNLEFLRARTSRFFSLLRIISFEF